MAVAGQGVASPSGAFEDTERLGSLLDYSDCSALVVGVADLFEQKQPTTRKPAPISACLSVHGRSGAGRSIAEQCVRGY